MHRGDLGRRRSRARRCRVRRAARLPTCHEPSDGAGTLAGDYAPVKGALAFPANLTGDRLTGLGGWADIQIVRAFRFGGGGAGGSWDVVTRGPVDYVPVAKAVAKLTNGKPCETAGIPCLCLKDGRRVLFKPKGFFEIRKSADDKKAIVGRKAISAIMMLRHWTFEQAVEWMNKNFGAAATMNTAGDYLALLVVGDR